MCLQLLLGPPVAWLEMRSTGMAGAASERTGGRLQRKGRAAVVAPYTGGGETTELVAVGGLLGHVRAWSLGVVMMLIGQGVVAVVVLGVDIAVVWVYVTCFMIVDPGIIKCKLL
jgi:hypothetical protein